nr:immunoglobulin heavy chain junction region [Mus musculus]MBK4196394.1 immunoglobulin heavy chain junction region [Mus musculus]MBK4196395.1 immunoglobulin heavy chain junction region [Mus musculus]MBK4196396.1 immunoglobulin heavy chain junction region [Mus musculus]MBK4196398.1 immunoglobulin heavy chain junction region [Mus musculus]
CANDGYYDFDVW